MLVVSSTYLGTPFIRSDWLPIRPYQSAAWSRRDKKARTAPEQVGVSRGWRQSHPGQVRSPTIPTDWLYDWLMTFNFITPQLNSEPNHVRKVIKRSKMDLTSSLHAKCFPSFQGSRLFLFADANTCIVHMLCNEPYPNNWPMAIYFLCSYYKLLNK